MTSPMGLPLRLINHNAVPRKFFMKKIIIIGASSGLGYKIASDFAHIGWHVGMAARRTEPMAELQRQYPKLIEYTQLDVTAADAVGRLHQLIDKLGGMDIFFYCSGCGWNNPQLDETRDLQTLNTNTIGFTQMINAAYKFYKDTNSSGQIAAITSIAGTKGIGISATYSASKRYQSTYLEAIDQLAHQQKVDVHISEIRPGFVATPFLDTATHSYPMTMSTEYAARRIERAILHRRHCTIVDWRWALVTVLWRIIPRPIWRHIGLK